MEYCVFKLNYIILYFLLIFGDKELYYCVLMLYICINYFDLILNNKEFKYLYIFFIRKRFEIFCVKEVKKKIIFI